MAKPLVPDELWQRIEPLIPKPRRKNRHVLHAGRKPTPDRKVLAGIIFVLQTGVPWRALPATTLFPSGHTCRRKLLKWHRAGVWEQLFEAILAELNHQGRVYWKRAIVDSASVRAPRGGKKTGKNPVDRRKLGTKTHLLTDAKGTPLSFRITGANRHDVTQLIALVEGIPPIRGRRGRPRSRPDRVQGDRAYDSEPKRRILKKSTSGQS